MFSKSIFFVTNIVYFFLFNFFNRERRSMWRQQRQHCRKHDMQDFPQKFCIPVLQTQVHKEQLLRIPQGLLSQQARGISEREEWVISFWTTTTTTTNTAETKTATAAPKTRVIGWNKLIKSKKEVIFQSCANNCYWQKIRILRPKWAARQNEIIRSIKGDFDRRYSPIIVAM